MIANNINSPISNKHHRLIKHLWKQPIIAQNTTLHGINAANSSEDGDYTEQSLWMMWGRDLKWSHPPLPLPPFTQNWRSSKVYSLSLSSYISVPNQRHSNVLFIVPPHRCLPYIIVTVLKFSRYPKKFETAVSALQLLKTW